MKFIILCLLLWGIPIVADAASTLVDAWRVRVRTTTLTSTLSGAGDDVQEIFESIDEMPLGTPTVDEAYDEGDTIDYSSGSGPFHGTFPLSGTPETWNTIFHVTNWWFESRDKAANDVNVLFYQKTSGAAVGIQYHAIMGYSRDYGTTIFIDSAFPIGLPASFFTGLISNESGLVGNDFRAETNNYADALFVDSTNDYVYCEAPTRIGDVDTAGVLSVSKGDTTYPIVIDGVSGEIRNGADQGAYSIQTATTMYAGGDITSGGDIYGDSVGADTINLLDTANIGDLTHAGTLALWDGAGNSISHIATDIASSFDVDESALGAFPDDYLVSYHILNGWTIVLTPVDSGSITPDTDSEVYMAGVLVTSVQTITTSNVGLLYRVGVVKSGTATFATVDIPTWTVPGVPEAPDTITFTLYVDGVAKDVWTDNSGTPGMKNSSAAITEAVTAGQPVQIWAQITTQNGALDTVKMQSWSLNVNPV